MTQLTNDLKIWLRLTVYIAGVVGLGMLLAVQLWGIGIVLKFPSVQSTCVFDEIVTPLSAIQKARGK